MKRLVLKKFCSLIFSCFSLLILGLSLSANSFAAVQTSSSETCSFLQQTKFEDKDGLKYKNCVYMLDKKLVSNQDAILYTLQYFENNFGRLADNKCAATPRGQVGEQNMNLGIISDGIKNGCQFLLNDLNSSYNGMPLRANSYYVNLCALTKDKIVTKLYVNKGVGTNINHYADVDDKHTSLVGAFLTAAETFAFTPYKWSPAYLQIKKLNGDKPIVALRLFGLNASNNDSAWSKPLHQSLYASSFGCPSMAPSNAYIMKALAANGPSLVLNYGPKKYHQSTINCCNDDSDKNCAKK